MTKGKTFVLHASNSLPQSWQDKIVAVLFGGS